MLLKYYSIFLGLTCTDENARTKAHFAQEAGRVGLAVVFPDTSPRGVDIEGLCDDGCGISHCFG